MIMIRKSKIRTGSRAIEFYGEKGYVGLLDQEDEITKLTAISKGEKKISEIPFGYTGVIVCFSEEGYYYYYFKDGLAYTDARSIQELLELI